VIEQKPNPFDINCCLNNLQMIYNNFLTLNLRLSKILKEVMREFREIFEQSCRYDITHKEIIIVDVSEFQPKYFLKSEVGDMMMMIQNTKKWRD